MMSSQKPPWAALLQLVEKLSAILLGGSLKTENDFLLAKTEKKHVTHERDKILPLDSLISFAVPSGTDKNHLWSRFRIFEIAAALCGTTGSINGGMTCC